MADALHSCEATFEGVRALAGHLQAWCEAAGVPEMARMDLELALVEAGNNVVRHGYAGQAGGNLALVIRTAPGGVELVLTDGGAPIPAARLQAIGEPALDSESGRGLALIAACTDRIDYAPCGKGNRLVLFKALA